MLTQTNLVVLVTVFIAGMVATAFSGYRSIAPSLRWFAAARTPTRHNAAAPSTSSARQSVILLTTWALSGAVLIVANATPASVRPRCSSSRCCSAAPRA